MSTYFKVAVNAVGITLAACLAGIVFFGPQQVAAQVVAQAAAQPQSEYRVEVLILRHLNNEGRSFEAPPQPKTQSDGPIDTSESARSERRVRWRGLPWKEFQLKSENSRLKRSRDFRPLLHLGWTQAALDNEESGWVPVRGQAEDGTRIDGRARLAVNRYLNLRLELNAIIPEKGEFRLTQSRRMKSGELHYFDHPEFGALVVIIREPPPEPEPEPESEGQIGAAAMPGPATRSGA